MYISLSVIVLIIIFIAICLLFRPRLLKEYTSSLLGNVVVWKKFNGELLLSTNGFTQGISIHDKSIAKSYWYYQAQQVIQYTKSKKNPTVLWLGLGAAVGPHIVAKEVPDLKQVAIEFDPVIIQADKEFFNLNEIKNLKVIVADAYKQIEKFANANTTYDVIVNDIYINAALLNGEKSSDSAFLEHVTSCLKPDGLLLFNRLAQTSEHMAQTEKLLPYLRKHFKTVEKYFVKDPRIYRNEIISARGKK